MYIDLTKKDAKDLLLSELRMLRNANKKIVVVSGFFDPIHRGHIEYIKKASEIGLVVCIVNTDEQAVLKKGKPFMPFDDRVAVVNAIRYISYTVPAIDKDITVCATLRLIKPDYFVKGGDRFASEIPEAKVCNELEIQMLDGLGAKVQSSSWIIRNANA